MKNLVQLNKDLKAKTSAIEDLLKKDDYSAEDAAKVEELQGEADAIVADIELVNQHAQNSTRLKSLQSYQSDPAGTIPHAQEDEEEPSQKSGTVPATARKSTSVKNFRGPGADKKAYEFGLFTLAAFGKNEKAKAYCKAHNILIKKGANESNNTDGGVLVPHQFDNDMIDLREEFGVFRANARVKNMTSDSYSTPRRKSGLRAVPVGESKAGEQSKMGWDRVGLTARKWMVLTKSSSEFNEDAAIELGDELFGEINYAFAETEDECGFLGDGTGKYHRIVGLQNALLGVKLANGGDATPAQIASLVIASSNDWNNLVITDFTRMTARVPAYIYKRKNVKWYCSQAFWSGVFQRIALEAGGNAVANLVSGVQNTQFMGYDVVVSQTLPLDGGAGTMPLYLGDLRETVLFGDRRQSTIAMSEHSAFEEDEIEWRATERFDINCYNTGNAAATAKDRKAGGVVGLYLPS